MMLKEDLLMTAGSMYFILSIYILHFHGVILAMGMILLKIKVFPILLSNLSGLNRELTVQANSRPD